MVVSVGIDVAKDKHDCFIQSSEGEVLADVFTISNNMDGFNILLEKIRTCTSPQDKIKVGLEARDSAKAGRAGGASPHGRRAAAGNPEWGEKGGGE